MIEIEAPDGTIVEFPDGTPDDVMARAMQQAFSAKPSMGESVGRGAVQGATLGFADEMAGMGAASPLPGSAAGKTTFGAMGAPDVIAGGVRMLANKLGIGSGGSEAYTAERDRVRSENDVAQKANPWSYGGGQAAGAVATAFAPGLQIARGASLGQQIGQGAALGAGMGAAQGAGEATEMKDVPGAALIGAGLGGAIGAGAPVLARGLGRLVSPFQASPERAAAVQRLADEGIELTAGQRTGSKPLRWLESTLGDMPGAGGRATRMQERQGEQFTQAAMRRAGSNANRATQENIDEAFRTVGARFDDLAARHTMQMDAPFAHDVGRTIDAYLDLVAESHQKPIVAKLVKDVMNLSQGGGAVEGAVYQNFRSRLESLARASNDSDFSRFLRGLRTAFDDAMERSIPAGPDRGAWQEARRQYANLIPIAKASTAAGEAAGEGLLSPAALRTQVKSQNVMNFARGRGELAGLVKDAQAAMTPLPNSGTAPRQNMQNLINMAGAGLGGSFAGLQGAMAGLLAPAMAGRLLFSRPVQAYLGNQVAAQAPPILGLLAAAPLRQQAIERARQRGLLDSR